jgi:hypothetical protein
MKEPVHQRAVRMVQSGFTEETQRWCIAFRRSALHSAG